MTEHTKEPWVATGPHGPGLAEFHAICDLRDDVAVIAVTRSATPEARRVAGPNAAHIVACVNACAGKNPEAFDELLAACKAALSFQPDVECGILDNPLSIRLAAAIAKAEAKP